MLSKFDLSRVPENVRSVASAIGRASGRAFLVGGPVRDLLMGVEPADWDVATDLSPEQVLGIFPRASTSGIEFGRVQYLGVDVVSLRGESGYADRRHPSSVTFGVPVEEDLRRRDFTVNAMAAEFDELLVIDPFDGRGDIEKHLLRAVGDARERLSEDPLRMLRAVRFKTALALDLDPAVAAALPGLAHLLTSVSGERVYAELSRILLAQAVQEGMLDLHRFGLGQVVLPEVFAIPYEAVERVALSVSLAPAELPTRLALLLGATSPDIARAVLERLGAPSDIREPALWLLKNSSESGFLRKALSEGEQDPAYLTRKLLDEAGARQVCRLDDFFQASWRGSGNAGVPTESAALAAGLHAVQADSQSGDLELPSLAVSGEDVMTSLGLQPGPGVGEALAYLKERVFRAPGLNRKDLLLAILLRWWRER